MEGQDNVMPENTDPQPQPIQPEPETPKADISAQKTAQPVVKTGLDQYEDTFDFGPIQPYMNDPLVSEIMINGPSRVFIERQGKKQLTEAGASVELK